MDQQLQEMIDEERNMILPPNSSHFVNEQSIRMSDSQTNFSTDGGSFNYVCGRRSLKEPNASFQETRGKECEDFFKRTDLDCGDRIYFCTMNG
jgi:hypothetical protein